MITTVQNHLVSFKPHIELTRLEFLHLLVSVVMYVIFLSSASPSHPPLHISPPESHHLITFPSSETSPHSTQAPSCLEAGNIPSIPPNQRTKTMEGTQTLSVISRIWSRWSSLGPRLWIKLTIVMMERLLVSRKMGRQWCVRDENRNKYNNKHAWGGVVVL